MEGLRVNIVVAAIIAGCIILALLLLGIILFAALNSKSSEEPR
jgi:hypothetical protein